MNNASTTVLCCGEERDENFCPFCGKKLRDYLVTLEGLLVHCRNKTNQLTKSIAKLKIEVKNQKDPEHYWHKDLKRTTVILHKWSEWARLLSELMEKSEPP